MQAIATEPRCPSCGSPRQARIVYGLVEMTPEVRDRIEQGAITLGGCCISSENPEWRCLDCHHEWGISQQSRRILECVEVSGSRGADETGPPWHRVLGWLLAVPLSIVVVVLLLVISRVIPAIRTADTRVR